MKTYLVTGGAGFIGSHLVDRLLKEGCKVVALDNLVTGSAGNLSHIKNEPNFEFIESDLIQGVPKSVGKIDGCFHMASPASPVDFVPLAISILKVGSIGTLHCLEHCQEHGAWFFMASTSEVYGDPLEHPQVEEYLGNVNPNGVRGVYDEAKRFSEALTTAFHRLKALPVSIVRIFNTFGSRMRKNDGRVIPNFISQALSGEPLTLYGGGEQTRSLCYVDDLIEGFMRFREKRPIGPINLGNDREMTIRELGEAIIKISGSESTFVDRPMPEGDPKKRCPNIGKAREILKWEPQVKLEDGLQKTIEYFKTVSH